MDSIEKEDWDIVIDQGRGLFDLKLKEIWLYRDLLWLFVRRDFVSFYKQTVLGPLWFFIQPIFTTAIYVFLFRNLAKLSTDGIPGPLFYVIGITVWSYFSETLLKVSNVLRDNASIFGKVYFPRLIMPLSIAFSGLFKFGVQLVVLICTMIYFACNGGGFHVGLAVLWFPFLILLMAVQSIGLGMMVAAMASKYRDLAMLLGFGLQLGMYATPIIYPLSSMQGIWKYLISLNPMTTIVEGMRYSVLGSGTVTNYGLIYTIGITIFIFIAGIVIFNRTEKTFVDTV